MLDRKGKVIRQGDRLAIGGGMEGTVVFSIDSDDFSADYPKQDWAYLEKGIIVDTDTAGFIYLPETDEEIEVIGRISKTLPS